MKTASGWLSLLVAGVLGLACQPAPEETATPAPSMKPRLAKYTSFRLETDLSVLSDRERRMIPILIEAAQVMDGLYWFQAYGDREALLSSFTDPDMRRFIEINYGPWDRLAGNEPFVPGLGPKPLGANFYPPDMTKEEFEAAAAASPRKNHWAGSLDRVDSFSSAALMVAGEDPGVEVAGRDEPEPTDELSASRSPFDAGDR